MLVYRLESRVELKHASEGRRETRLMTAIAAWSRPRIDRGDARTAAESSRLGLLKTRPYPTIHPKIRSVAGLTPKPARPHSRGIETIGRKLGSPAGAKFEKWHANGRAN